MTREDEGGSNRFNTASAQGIHWTPLAVPLQDKLEEPRAEAWCTRKGQDNLKDKGRRLASLEWTGTRTEQE